MEDCIFCRIVKGEMPAYVIHENENYLAFLDISQFTEGHTLIIPKKHYRYIWDIEDSKGFFDFAKEVANHFKNLGLEYVDSASFGRMVPHAHWHLIPHDGNNQQWQEALKKLGDMQSDNERRLQKDNGDKIVNRLKF